MSRVWIFGDSFADPDSVPPYRPDYAWPTRIANEYTTENHALKGTGPDWSLQKLLERLNVGKPKTNTDLIFVMSDTNRLNLQNFWKDPCEQVHILDVGLKNIKHPGYMFVKNLYNHLLVDELYVNRELAIIGTVNLLSHWFRRVLIWPIGDFLHSDTVQLNSNVSIVTQGLIGLSLNEYISNNPGNAGLDNRANHFSKPNHIEMYRQLTNWIETGATPQTQEFVQSIV